ncbi:MAG TPA: AzlD domain-containing protein [Mycobacteriales bacterium]|nr:AzlD domain-containing protein [Mycobacteriales bacterium]
MSAGTVWLVIALAALTTVVTKGAGPAATGSRELPAPAVRVVVLLAAPLLTALVVTNALADGQELRVGADTAGAVAAALLVWRRAHVVVVVVVAAAITSFLRLVG